MKCEARPRGEGPFLLTDLYSRLLEHFGPQGWWPGDGPFEMMVGAVLTQNTAWTNVEKAITNLKENGLLKQAVLAAAPVDKIESAIRPAGYFRQKAARLKGFAVWFGEEWNGDTGLMFTEPTLLLRERLLDVKGLGPETVDSILLYAGGKSVFVIDAYTRRIVGRLGLTDLTGYDELQQFFVRNLPVDVELYQEYHALLVRLGKTHCLADSAKADCPACPVGGDCEHNLLAEV